MGRSARLRLAIALTAVLSGALLATAAPVLGYAVDETNNATAATYNVCEHPWSDPDSYNYPCTRTIASVSVSATANARYRLTSSATYGNATDTTFVSASIECSINGTPITGNSGELGTAQNLLVSESFSLTPTLVIVPPSSGTLACTLEARGTKTVPGSNTWRIQAGWLHVTGTFLSGSTNTRLGSPATLSSTNPTVDIYIQNQAVSSSWDLARVYGQAYVSTTGSSSQFTAQLIFAQYPYSSGVYCDRDESSALSYNITTTRQHYTVYRYQAFTKTNGCDDQVKAILRLEYTGGAALTVSSSNSLIALPIE